MSCAKDLYGNMYATTPTADPLGLTCPRNSLCVKGPNPNEEWTAFDNIIIASFTIFQMMTLEVEASP